MTGNYSNRLAQLIILVFNIFEGMGKEKKFFLPRLWIFRAASVLLFTAGEPLNFIPGNLCVFRKKKPVIPAEKEPGSYQKFSSAGAATG